MDERQYDHDLNIQTVGIQQGFHDSVHYNRYEPTPYKLLEELFSKHPLSAEDRLVDFGSGKGRLNFLVHHLFDAASTGVEMDQDLHQKARENLDSYVEKRPAAKGRIVFNCTLAEQYRIHPQDNKFYFFNPFSSQIFITVLNNILKSVERSPRPIELILFFPSEDYLGFLEHSTAFEQIAEIELPGVEADLRERFLIYRLG